MEVLFIGTANFYHLLGNLVKKNLFYAPRKKGDFLFYEKIGTTFPKDLVLHTNRPVQPLKSFFFPPYQKVSQYFRDNSLLISSDCLGLDEYSFCTLLGSHPYPEGGFDLNLSPVNGGADEALLAHREKIRANSQSKVKELNQEVEVKSLYRDLIRKSYSSAVWKDYSESCVDCGGCNEICPTCQCFLLQDGREKERFERVRL